MDGVDGFTVVLSFPNVVYLFFYSNKNNLVCFRQSEFDVVFCCFNSRN